MLSSRLMSFLVFPVPILANSRRVHLLGYAAFLHIHFILPFYLLSYHSPLYSLDTETAIAKYPSVSKESTPSTHREDIGDVLLRSAGIFDQTKWSHGPEDSNIHNNHNNIRNPTQLCIL
jgi:hypothetical protein